MNPQSSTVQHKLQHLIDEIRASDALIVLGAGASFDSGMPMAGQLTSLVWHTIDQHENLRVELSKDIGKRATSAKELIGDDDHALAAAFNLIDLDSAASETFRRIFSNLNNSRLKEFSPFHDELAKLLFIGKIRGVISFNWDTLLETAFHRLYGISLNAQARILWKPHGNCASPEKWVLPHEPGNAPEKLIQWTNQIATERPRTLLLIGYSERDEVIVQRLIQPLSKSWRVFRISPDAEGEGAIQLPALTAVQEIARQLAHTSTNSHWKPVTFDNQRGIEAAISGERLGPRDADACPKLPHYNDAKKALELLHWAEIAGQSGCGKSITLWQLAREYQREGWLVVQAAQFSEKDEPTALKMIRQLRWKSIIVLDDSQTYSRQFASALRNLANEQFKVILGTTDANWEEDSAIRISATAAVETLAIECLKRKEAILPIIQRFDSHIGDGYMDARYEGRIDLARKEKTPWQFFFVLRSGWQQTRLAFNSLRDFDNANFALLMIAANQLTTLDGGLSLQELIRCAERNGSNRDWVKRCIELLASKKIILVGEKIRCLHVRAAVTIIAIAFSGDVSSDREKAAEVIRSILVDQATSLRGASWLLGEASFHGRNLIHTLETNTALLERAFSASSNSERRDACFVISHLIGWKGQGVRDLIHANGSIISSWICETNSENAYALGQVINNLHNDDGDYCKELISTINPSVIASKLPTITHATAYVWGHLLGRLGCAADDTWRNGFITVSPHDSLRELMATCPPSDVRQIQQFIEGIACYDLNLSLDLLELAAPSISKSFTNDSIGTYKSIHHLNIWVLGRGLFSEERPSKRQRTVEKKLLEGTNPVEVANGILNSRYGDWETYSRMISWLKDAHPRRHKEIVKEINLDLLEPLLDAHWRKPGREFRLLLMSLTTKRSSEPVSSWLLKHASKIKEIDPILTALSPELAVELLSNGGKVNLNGHNGNWYGQIWAIAHVANINEDAARTILRTNFDHLVTGITELSLPDGLPKLLNLAAHLDAELLSDIANTINLENAALRWEKALKDNRAKERKGARGTLKILAATNSLPVKNLANDLLRRIRYRKAK